MTRSRDVHLVGSMNVPDAQTAFATVSSCLGDRATRVPDGEFGERADWSYWGAMQMLEHEAFEHGGESPFGGFWVRRKQGTPLESIAPIGYAEHAEASYRVFSERRAAGELAPTTRFLVALPTPFAWAGYLIVEDRAEVEPYLEQAMLEDLNAICRAIPENDLAIQWDVSNEIGVLENIEPNHFEDPLGGCAQRLARLIDAVPGNVDVGLHLCYGSYENKHFIEPRDTAVMVSLLNETLSKTAKTLSFVHMPVPIERDDPEYFAPLAALGRDRINELYLGLVHLADGLGGSARRIAAAQATTDDFGLSTECGIARFDEQLMRPILELEAESADLAS